MIKNHHYGVTNYCQNLERWTVVMSWFEDWVIVLGRVGSIEATNGYTGLKEWVCGWLTGSRRSVRGLASAQVLQFVCCLVVVGNALPFSPFLATPKTQCFHIPQQLCLDLEEGRGKWPRVSENQPGNTNSLGARAAGRMGDELGRVRGRKKDGRRNKKKNESWS